MLLSDEGHGAVIVGRQRRMLRVVQAEGPLLRIVYCALTFQ